MPGDEIPACVCRVLRSEAEEIPEDGYVAVQHMLPQFVYERLLKICSEESISVSAYIRRLVITYMPDGN